MTCSADGEVVVEGANVTLRSAEELLGGPPDASLQGADAELTLPAPAGTDAWFQVASSCTVASFEP